MHDAGVHVLDALSIAMEMMRDWRNVPGAAEVLPWMDEYVPSYGLLARAHSQLRRSQRESGVKRGLYREDQVYL
jgi:hypothetical protein